MKKLTQKDKNGCFYLTEMIDKESTISFIKIGITQRNPLKRLTLWKNKCRIRILFERMGTIYDSFLLEKNVKEHMNNKTDRFIPLYRFGGWTECYKQESLGKILEIC